MTETFGTTALSEGVLILSRLESVSEGDDDIRRGLLSLPHSLLSLLAC